MLFQADISNGGRLIAFLYSDKNRSTIPYYTPDAKQCRLILRIGERCFAYRRKVFWVYAKGCAKASRTLRKGFSPPASLCYSPRLLTLEQSYATAMR